jgi:hypothetical protein
MKFKERSKMFIFPKPSAKIGCFGHLKRIAVRGRLMKSKSGQLP